MPNDQQQYSACVLIFSCSCECECFQSCVVIPLHVTTYVQRVLSTHSYLCTDLVSSHSHQNDTHESLASRGMPIQTNVQCAWWWTTLPGGVRIISLLMVPLLLSSISAPADDDQRWMCDSTIIPFHTTTLEERQTRAERRSRTTFRCGQTFVISKRMARTDRRKLSRKFAIVGSDFLIFFNPKNTHARIEPRRCDRNEVQVNTEFEFIPSASR